MPPRKSVASSLEEIRRRSQRQIQMTKELADSQTWKGDQGTVYEKKETIQRRMIRSAVERNQKFFSKIENRLPRAEARMLQNAKREDILMKDAENSEHKHWISNTFKRKAARKQSPLADESSYDMHEAIGELERSRKDVLTPKVRDVEENHPELLNDKRVDWRELRVFVEGYRLNAQVNLRRAEMRR